MEPIRSPRNPRVVAASRLQRVRQRKALGQTLLEGPHLIAEALSAGWIPEEVFVQEGDVRSLSMFDGTNVIVWSVSDDILRKVAPSRNPRGPVAVMAIPPGTDLNGPAIVLWDVADPGNAGTLVRSAGAFGFSIAATPSTVDLWSPKVLRSAAGAHGRVPISEIDSMADLSAHVVVASVVSGGVDPREIEVEQPVALLVGNEAHGLPPDVLAEADLRVTLPMIATCESLNAAVAGSLIAFLLAGSIG